MVNLINEVGYWVDVPQLPQCGSIHQLTATAFDDATRDRGYSSRGMPPCREHGGQKLSWSEKCVRLHFEAARARVETRCVKASLQGVMRGCLRNNLTQNSPNLSAQLPPAFTCKDSREGGTK